MDNRRICGTCKYHQFEEIDSGFICVNCESENCADWTDYEHTCDEWEERGD